jgi:phenylacetate-CoA ligase
VFPSQVEDVLLKIEGIEPHYLIVIDRVQGMDSLEIKIEVAEEIFSDIMADMVAFTRRVSDRLNAVLGLSAKVTLVEPGTIERSVGKAKHVSDLRSMD